MRTREQIQSSAQVGESKNTYRLRAILEVLLDIRDLLDEQNEREISGSPSLNPNRE